MTLRSALSLIKSIFWSRRQELIFKRAGIDPVASLSTSQTQIGASEEVSRISTLDDVN